MVKKVLFWVSISLLTTASGVAQINYLDNLSPTGISNTGTVSGYYDFAGSYYLWNPTNANTLQEIGGNAQGNGIGGFAKFSADNIFLSGSKYYQSSVNTDWAKSSLGSNYTINSVNFPNLGRVGFAAGSTQEGNGFVMITKNGGKSWSNIWTASSGNGIKAMAVAGQTDLIVAGNNKYFAQTNDAGTTWKPIDPTSGNTNVNYYSAVDFTWSGTVTAAVMNNDSSYIYYTSEYGTIWNKGLGLKTIVNDITLLSGTSFYLVTNSGSIMNTIDGGVNWETRYSGSDPLYKIRFFEDEMTGIATSNNKILKTTDGGLNWTALNVAGNFKIDDVIFISDVHYFAVGANGSVYETVDGGSNWTFSNQTVADSNTEIYEITQTDSLLVACGSGSALYTKSLTSVSKKCIMSRYDVNTGEWTALGSLDYSSGNTMSSGYAISGDGNVVVGNAYVDPSNSSSTTSYADAFVWSKTEGVIDLGSLYGTSNNRSSRANAISEDGKTIVGYQELTDGMWKSAVWRKNTTGAGYAKNVFLLVDPNGSETDESNQLGEASCVSSDGKWIGGYGDYFVPSAWIWSESTGVIKIGEGLYPEGAVGYVSGMNSDASIVVGYYQYSNLWSWSTTYYPFIWFKDKGLKPFNKFVTDELQLTGTRDSIYSVSGISGNGKYITGWGVSSLDGSAFAFKLDMSNYLTKVSNTTLTTAKAYPNPMKDYLMIENEDKIDMIKCYDITGKMIMNLQPDNTTCRVNTASLSQGVYNFVVTSGGKTQTMKMVK